MPASHPPVLNYSRPTPTPQTFRFGLIPLVLAILAALPPAAAAIGNGFGDAMLPYTLWPATVSLALGVLSLFQPSSRLFAVIAIALSLFAVIIFPAVARL